MAATTFYVDGDGDFTAAQTGAIDAAFGGPYGLQKALDTSGAGISFVYAKATACRLDRLALLTYAHAGAAEDWAIGDAIRNDTGDGDDWTGTVCENDTTNHKLLIETLTGYYANIAIADGLENTTQSETATCSAKATAPIDINVAIGTAAARLSIIGCKDDISWTRDGTATVQGSRFVLDANGAVANCIVCNGTGQYWSLANFELDAATSHGFVGTTAYSLGAYFENVWAHNCGGDGLSLVYTYNPVCVRCRCENNTAYGVQSSYPAVLIACELIANATGFYAWNAGPDVLIDCVLHGNTVDNLSAHTVGVVLVNCVVDGAGRHGLNTDAAMPLMAEATRVTNNGDGASEYGLNLASGAWTFLRHCLFTGNRGVNHNTGDQDIGGAGSTGAIKLDMGLAAASIGATNTFDGNATDDDYTGDPDFNLTDAARLRSVADLLPDT